MTPHSANPNHSPHPPHGQAEQLELPRPTIWPLTLALALAVSLGGLVTNLAFTALGLSIFVVSLAGWLRELVVAEAVQPCPLVPEHQRAKPTVPSERQVEALRPGMPGHRMQLPARVYPYRAGLRGGAVGGLVMALAAAVYGLISGRGVWYPINLLAGIVMPRYEVETLSQLEEFHAASLAIGLGLHASLSLGIGLIFAVVSPTLPRWPLFWAGIVAPIIWSGGVYAFMGIINPAMNSLVDWPWFVASQFLYGLTMGFVVQRSERSPVEQFAESQRS